MAETVNLDEHIDYAQYYAQHITKAKRTGDNLNGLCPFHDDHQASFGAELKTGKWKCLAGCGQGNVVSFHARINRTDTKTAFRDLCRIYHISSNTGGRTTARNTGTLDPSILDSLEPIPPTLKNYLVEKRGWSQSILQEYRIGYSQKKRRYTIPVFDERGDLVNIRCYAPEKQGDKVKSWATGYGQSRLYPLSSLKWAIEGEGLIVLCEGEPDCLCGLSHGLICITQTAGAETWKDPFNTQFKGLNVVIAYDNDQAGKDGAQRVARHLPGFAESVEILQWPEWMHEKEDLTDWFVKYGKSAQELLRLPRARCGKEEEEDPTVSLFGALDSARIDRFLDNQPKPYRWLLNNTLLRGTVGSIIANGGLGKSYFFLQMAITIAIGMLDFLNGLWEVGAPGKVYCLFCEDEETVIHHRLEDVLQGMFNKDPEVIETFKPILRESLFIHSGVGYDTRLMKMQHENFESTPAFEHLLEFVKGIPDLRLVILDPLSHVGPGAESDQAAATFFVQMLQRISSETGATVLFSHHTNKIHGSQSGESALIQEAVRGASALTNAVRWQCNLARMDQSQVKRIGGDPAEYFRYIMGKVTKKNVGPPEDVFYLYRDSGGVLRSLAIDRDNSVDATVLDKVCEKIVEMEAAGEKTTKWNFVRNYAGVFCGYGRDRLERVVNEAIQEGTLGLRSGKDEKNREAMFLTTKESSSASL